MDYDYAIPFSQTAPANTAITVTLPERNGYRIGITDIVASYSAAPTAGLLTVTSAGKVILLVDVAAGLSNLDYTPPLADQVGEAVTLTLAAGGAAVVGFLNGAYVYIKA